MAAQTVKVTPRTMMQAAASISSEAVQAAAPAPGIVPVVVTASPADAALAAIAAGVATQSTAMNAQLAGTGPQVVATTQAGVAQLQGVDETNADQVRAVGQSASADPGMAIGGAAGLAPGAGIVQTAFSTSLGDGWDDETEEELEVPHGWSQDHLGNWHPPVAEPGGAAGGSGFGRAPI